MALLLTQDFMSISVTVPLVYQENNPWERGGLTSIAKALVTLRLSLEQWDFFEMNI
jgi:hypothetical protein